MNGYCTNNSDPNIIHCNIEGNKYYYGGIYCDNSNPNITNCLISRNGNEYGYGGMYNNSSSPTVTNCVFRGNRAYYCGGICNYSSSPTVTNCTLRGNTANDYGGGMHNENNSSPVVTNCIFWGDTAADGNEIYNYNSSVPNITYCDIQGDTVYPGTGNINADPCFYDATTDPNSYHLTQNSPCIDKGDPNADYSGETDIDGEKRKIDGDSNGTEIVDIGADEYYWIVNFFDYAEFANAWWSTLGESNYNDIFDLEDDGFIDYADLAIFCEDWLSQAGWARALACGVGRGMIQSMATGFAPAEVSYPSVLVEQQIEKVEPLKIEQLIKWLEELWLDEETQKVIDKDAWLKLIESLKEEL